MEKKTETADVSRAETSNESSRYLRQRVSELEEELRELENSRKYYMDMWLNADKKNVELRKQVGALATIVAAIAGGQ